MLMSSLVKHIKMRSSRVRIASVVSTDGHESQNKSVILMNLTTQFLENTSLQPIWLLRDFLYISLSNKCQDLLQNKDLLS